MKNWEIIETNFDPNALRYKETVFTLGNGYLGTRSTFEEGYMGEESLTLIHGIFDDVSIVHTELVNVPNWIHCEIVINGERFRLDRGVLLDYCRKLDLHNGVLTRVVRWRSPAGYTFDIAFERFASLADEHILGVRCKITSVDFTGAVEVRAGLPGYVDNTGFVHWQWLDQGSIDQQTAYLTVCTKKTALTLSMACHVEVEGAGPITYHPQDCTWSPTVMAQGNIAPGQALTATKLVTVFTARDTGVPQTAALDKLQAAVKAGYDAARVANDAAWADVWNTCNITIEGDDEADLAVRYSLFQLLIAAPRHDSRVSIPAKTLSGLGYRGHAFWDTEIFMLPFFIYTQPDVAHNMLLYRYHTLPGARRKAAENGYEGAMFAWESAATGDETTPRWVPGRGGELIRIWCGDIELHITADIAYAVHTYWRATGDDAFMRDYGAELILDTARFWGVRVEWNAARGVYEINDVIGPDENHDHVNNNAYTNHLVRWNLQMALHILSWLRATYPEKAAALCAQLELTPERLAHWRDVIANICIAHDPETHLIEQFDGFFELETVDFNDYEPRVTSMQGLLGVEETQKYQILKQPDVLMMHYLLPDAYDSVTVKANWDYYTPRTDLTYGSSLGPAIQAALAARQGDIGAAYQHFLLAARTDLQNARGNTGEGIHGATAGGIWQAVVFGFGGARLTEEGIICEPRLPSSWTRVAFQLVYQGERITFDLVHR
ncbi:MAG: glycoside hydrolase family 65 protein [Anaerolineae bacterium]|nr:glycoside hydrolase family 65 protein [Anaerolineae bacterium]